MLKRTSIFLLTAIAAAALLSGCATPMRPVSVTDTLALQPELSTLRGLVVKAGLADTLKGPGPLTVFAPSNEAFAKVPAKTMEGLANDPARLKAVLAYHVLPALVRVADVRNGNSKTVHGANLALSRAGDFVTVEDALVQTPDISASNGVVHIIDSVLLPPATR
ncbi:MAG: beta-Ig-H3/fasciclin [Polaromonas sp.]|jgi:uncharacterized surface protein with fasciclin (FAS1) repeats|nr:beta-Ig-H3/fasciclin [Polaromonas sp.]